MLLTGTILVCGEADDTHDWLQSLQVDISRAINTGLLLAGRTLSEDVRKKEKKW